MTLVFIWKQVPEVLMQFKSSSCQSTVCSEAMQNHRTCVFWRNNKLCLLYSINSDSVLLCSPTLHLTCNNTLYQQKWIILFSHTITSTLSGSSSKCAKSLVYVRIQQWISTFTTTYILNFPKNIIHV